MLTTDYKCQSDYVFTYFNNFGLKESPSEGTEFISKKEVFIKNNKVTQAYKHRALEKLSLNA